MQSHFVCYRYVLGGSDEYIYLRALSGQTYSTQSRIEKQCTRTPDGQWSQAYGTVGAMDFGLATRDYRSGATTTTSVICRVRHPLADTMPIAHVPTPDLVCMMAH